MDFIIAAAAVLLILGAAAGIAFILRIPGVSDEIPPFAAVVPVWENDRKLPERLATLSEKLAFGDCCTGYILLLDFGAGEEELAICRSFCAEFTQAVIVPEHDLQKILSKTFAFQSKT